MFFFNNVDSGIDKDADEDDDEEAGDEEDATAPLTMGMQMCRAWDKRRVKLEHDYSIAGWALSVMPEVREDCLECMTGEHHNAIERVITKLHLAPCPNKATKGMSIEAIIDLFWDEFKTFQQKLDPFDKQHRWNSQDAAAGKSWLWHEKYSLPYTKVLGFVACRVCSKTLGRGGNS